MTEITCNRIKHDTYPMPPVASENAESATWKNTKGGIASQWTICLPNGFTKSYNVVVIHGRKPQIAQENAYTITETGKITEKSKYASSASTTGRYTSFIAINDSDFEFSKEKNVPSLTAIGTDHLFERILNVFYDLNVDLRPINEQQSINEDWQRIVENYLRQNIVPLIESEKSVKSTCITVGKFTLAALAIIAAGFVTARMSS